MSGQQRGNYASALHTLAASASQPSLGASNGAGSLRRTAQISTQIKIFAQPRGGVKSQPHRSGGSGKGAAPAPAPNGNGNGMSDSKRPVALRSTSQSLSASRGSAAAFNVSSTTGVPKHLETYGDVAIAATARRQSTAPLGATRPAFGASFSASVGASTEGGLGESLGGRERAKSSANPFSASVSVSGTGRGSGGGSGSGSGSAGSGANRYCPVGSRPRFTFTGPPEHLKPILRLTRPRFELPEDPQSLSSVATPYQSHPAFTATRAICDAHRARLAEEKAAADEQAKINAMIKKYGAQQTKIGRSVIPQADPNATSNKTQRLPTASAPPPPSLPANANSPTYRFPRRIAYDPSDFGRDDSQFYRPLSVEEHRYIALQKATTGGNSKPSGTW